MQFNSRRVRLFIAIVFFLAAVCLGALGTSVRSTSTDALSLRFEKFRSVRRLPGGKLPANPASPSIGPTTPTFGHPVIAGIGGTGFEESIRVDPTLNANGEHTIYTSAPGSASADTSWIWHSLDGGRTFKWVAGAAPFTGKVTTCHGGGDTEIAVDPFGRLYFNDLTLANFSTARSDDFGATFTCSNTGVPDTAVDRQWYAIDGDPLSGGSIYLANDEIGPGGVVCGTTPANNVLVMYRSPVTTALATTAGVEFGPANHVTPVGGCDEAIMGNNEISPVATTLGQPNTAPLATAVKHIYVIHDNVELNKILIGRCFPVAFGAPVPNVSDPSGLNCTDLLVADLGPGQKTGANFPTLAIDKAGNLYAVWEQAPLGPATNATGDLAITGDTVLKFSYSTDQGNTWSTPMTIDTSGSPDGVLHNNVFAWITAGDDGRVNIVWYGTPGVANEGGIFDFIGCGRNVLNPPPGGKNINGPDAVDGLWSVWMVQSVNAHDPAGPIFTAPLRASSHHVHRGSVMTIIGGQCGWASRALGDYLQLRTGTKGEANISYADSNSVVSAFVGHAMYVRQNGGTGLFAAQSPVSVSGHTAFNGVVDLSGDGKYEAAGTSSANMPQLDILSSNITLVTSAPCSSAAPCYKVFMRLNDLSLAPTIAQDPNPDLVWNTQWFVPSTSDGNGGKNFHVYAESFNGTFQCFVGENGVQALGGGGVVTYPGKTQLPAANCQSTLGPNGNITIYVPLSEVSEANPVDANLHEVTASTMTLLEPANTRQPDPVTGFSGSYFNLIDAAPAYIFQAPAAVSRKTHGAAGTYDVDLPLIGAPGVECRTGGSSGDHQIVVKFAVPVTFNSVGTTCGNISGLTTSGTDVAVNLTGVPTSTRCSLTLTNVNDGVTTGDVVVPVNFLLGDTNADGEVNSGDISQTKSQSGTAIGASNFREDVNIDGDINSGDISFVKSRSGTALPPP